MQVLKSKIVLIVSIWLVTSIVVLSLPAKSSASLQSDSHKPEPASKPTLSLIYEQK